MGTWAHAHIFSSIHIELDQNQELLLHFSASNPSDPGLHYWCLDNWCRYIRLRQQQINKQQQASRRRRYDVEASFLPDDPRFSRVSDRDLTEIELHSVDSINDLHRTHPEHSHKGLKPPRPAYTPSPNGNLYSCDMTAVNQRGPGVSTKWQSHLQDLLTPSSSRAYAMGCAIVTLLLLTVLLIFYFLVQQGGALRMLMEAVREKQAAATELSLLIQELQVLRRNLTATRGGT